MNGVYVTDCPTIEVEDTPEHSAGFDLEVELQNRADRWLKTVSCRVGLFAPIEFFEATPNLSFRKPRYRRVTLDANKCLFLPKSDFSLVPEMWDSIWFSPTLMNRDLKIGEEFEFCIRLYFDSGCADFPFHVYIKS